MKRFWIPTLFNLLVPGTGLIVLGRPWVGLALAGGFFLGAELAIIGLLVTPATVPQAASAAAAVAAGMVWLLGQGLLIARVRFLRSAERPRELAILHRLAQQSLSRSDFGTTRAAIAMALAIDDADLMSHLLRARLLSQTGRRAKAERAWLLVRRLDVEQRHIEEAASNLRTRPSG